jgi:hypothetical protein
VAAAAPRTTPLTIVSAAVAGETIESIAAAAAAELGRPVAIALPGIGQAVVCPAAERSPETLEVLTGLADTVVVGQPPVTRPSIVADWVPIRIGEDVVGIVAVLGDAPARAEDRAWLDAAAAAATVSSLIREAKDGDLEAGRRAFLQALAASVPADIPAMLGEAHRLGCDLTAGGAAVCAEAPGGAGAMLATESAALLAEVAPGRVLGVVPLAGGRDGRGLELVADELQRRGMRVATSMPRRDPGGLHDAIREAEVMLALAGDTDALLSSEEETYRLLIGVLLHDPDELQSLRTSTISALEEYDAEHDTELLATLRAFLTHHGSTTETAEAMGLHRHTVGYRLSRVHEVSGLSPYESDGRERLSLGIKAHRILEADRRRAGR